MPKPRKKEVYNCEFFAWKLGRRSGVYFADGRSGNRFDLGRHSLGTKNFDEAVDNMKTLDRKVAVDRGQIKPEELARRSGPRLTLQDGWGLYRAHISRPRVARGTRPKTVQRYGAVMDKFFAVAVKAGVEHWNDVTKDLLVRYGAWLDGEGYAYRTEYLELTTLKQCVKWLRQAAHLSDSLPRIDLPLRKPTGTDTYCYRFEEVNAMVSLCLEDRRLGWMGEIIVALAATGLRISELASLRWSDINLEDNLILLTDESARSPHKVKALRRETKSGHSRSFPIGRELREVLLRKERAADGVLFRGPLGGRLKPDTVRNVLIRDVLRPLSQRFPTPEGEIGFEDGRLHSYRHYFCSTRANSGKIPELAVMRWLGHRDSSMVKHYYHLHDHEAQRLMEQVCFIGNTGGTVPSVIEEKESARAVEVATT
jgi:integrase